MRTHTSIFAALAALALAAGSAGAQGKGHDKDKGHEKDHDKAEKHISREDAQAIRLRDQNRVRPQDIGSRVPPGLAKKPGQMPPGQYKKRYGTSEGATVLGDIFRRRGYTVTRVAPYGQSQYVYYRLRDGAERRALVSTGTNQLQFTNVPATILQAVLAQLY
ncbi:MAG: hypothetical protein JWL61_5252 [Gemmatimonadetes bacterium]|nr:hypothetical protein [Gemmatimonadota bacterium]